MGRFNWGPGGPPEDAYSRVTAPERFGPLHGWALAAVARLQEDFEVTLYDGEVVDAELERVRLSRPTLKLTPLYDSYAPVTVAFTDFPGLGVRVGRWATDWFPSCGCDACDEVPEREFERFEGLLGDAVAGRFRESMGLRLIGDGWRTSEFWSDDHRSSRRSRVPRGEARQSLNGKREIVLEWQPWPRRQADTASI